MRFLLPSLGASAWAQRDQGQGWSSAQSHHWAAPLHPCAAHPSRPWASLAWVPPGTGLPPYGWSIRSIPMPEGGILTGPVWIGGLTPGWHSPDCDLPAPGTQALPEAFPCVGLCRATDAWELCGACVWVSGGPHAHPRMAYADVSLGAASCQAKSAC